MARQLRKGPAGEPLLLDEARQYAALGAAGGTGGLKLQSQGQWDAYAQPLSAPLHSSQYNASAGSPKQQSVGKRGCEHWSGMTPHYPLMPAAAASAVDI